MKKRIDNYIKSHNLINRVYDMLDYLNFFKNNKQDVELLKKNINLNLHSKYSVETLAKYFEEKKRKNNKNIELRCNLIDLINNLNYLKQYLIEKT